MSLASERNVLQLGWHAHLVMQVAGPQTDGSVYMTLFQPGTYW